MKTRFILIAVFLTIAFSSNSVFAQDVYAPLEELFRNKQFFDLRDQVAKQGNVASSEMLFYRGAVANKFNRLQDSIQLLQGYLKTAKDNDKYLQDCFELLADDYVRTYQYAKAAEAFKLLLDKFKAKMDADKLVEAESSFKTWNAVRTAPPQIISFAADTKIQATRDKANLLNIPVESNNQRINFVFDTGANISTITESTAKKLALKIIKADISVGTSTDKRVNSQIAIMPELKIGNISVKNAVFQILDDKDLAFPQINYQIDGIVGFPIIEAFRAVSISKKDVMSIKAHLTSQRFEQNMCLDELMPIVWASFNNQRMIFAFDTGAMSSTFYPLFYKSQEAEIRKTAKQKKVILGGAGGSQEVSAYILDKPALIISGKSSQLNNIEVLTEPVNDDSRYYFGNLGQDVIKNFDQMTLDFVSMSIVFE
jgi:hypothetical protein